MEFLGGWKCKGKFKNTSKNSKNIPSGLKASLVDQNHQNIPSGSKASNIPQWTRNHHENSSVIQDHQLNPK